MMRVRLKSFPSKGLPQNVWPGPDAPSRHFFVGTAGPARDCSSNGRFGVRRTRTLIEIENLGRTYRVHRKEAGLKASLRALFFRQWTYKHALRSISLRVGEGEILGLVGANGAGKTTLVKILAGIIQPDPGGRARVLGFIPGERHDDFRRQISLIMGQKAQLWWDLPAADSFLLLREIYQIEPARFDRNLKYLSAALEVDSQLSVQLRRLSLGERMKMELIAALLHEPRVVFLDEPTIGLDLSAQRAIRNFILEYRQRHRPAMIVTSHYMEDIERLCRRIAILREGQIVYDGPLARIVQDYARHKVISARLQSLTRRPRIPAGLGTILSYENGFLRLQTPRAKAADAASYLLGRLPVIDLNIEEEEIGTIIERIQRNGQGYA